MRKLLKPIAFAVAIPLFGTTIAPHEAGAQAKLRGIESFDLYVQSIGESPTECGINRDLTGNAFVFLASSAKFTVSKAHAAAHPALELITHTVVNRRIFDQTVVTCATYIELRSYYSDTVPHPLGEGTLYSEAILWSTTGITISGAQDHPKQVVETIEQYTKEFVSEWNSANK